MTDAFIIAARRTAIGHVGGLHRNRPLEALAAPLIGAVLADAGLNSSDVDEVVLGNAVGGGGNPARLIALAAGLSVATPAMTIDRQCASGLEAILSGARLIETGAAEIVLAGGAESVSTAPWRVAKPASLYRDLPRFYREAGFVPGDPGDGQMLRAAENVARKYQIPRARQDAYALESHRRAVEAANARRFDDEMLALGKGAGERRDECPKAEITARLLSRLPPLAAPDGTVTAGSACPVNDGAALVVLVSRAIHERLGRPPGLRLIASAAAGVEPELCGMGAVPAYQKLLKQLGAEQAGKITTIAFNEAFAAQVLATLDVLGLDPSRVNADGGALALGHPYGASGAILVVRLFTQMVRESEPENAGLGVAMLASAGGLGLAAAFAPM